MQSASGTSSSGQVSATPTSEFAISRSSPAHGGGQGGGRPPPNFPRFNLPDSYWTRKHHVPSDTERFLEQAGVRDCFEQVLAESRQGQDNVWKAIENQLDSRPVLVLEHLLPPEKLAKLSVLKDPDDVEPQPQSSTSPTSSAAAAAPQQNAATGGCCIPPGCNIV